MRSLLDSILHSWLNGRNILKMLEVNLYHLEVIQLHAHVIAAISLAIARHLVKHLYIQTLSYMLRHATTE